MVKKLVLKIAEITNIKQQNTISKLGILFIAICLILQGYFELNYSFLEMFCAIDFLQVLQKLRR